MVEMAGRPGDVYFFLNDVWHGRAPNIHGTRNIILRFNGYPSEYDAPENVPLPKACAAFEGEIGRRYSRNQGINTDPDTLIRRLENRRSRSDLFSLAAREKKFLIAAGKRLGWYDAKLRVRRQEARPGDQITVRWSGLPEPHEGDYIALHDGSGTLLTYVYLNGGSGAVPRKTGAAVVSVPASASEGGHELVLKSGRGGILSKAPLTVSPTHSVAA